MRDIERRLAKLEQVREQEVTMVCLVSFVSPGVQRAVKGWKGDGYYIARKPGESEEALAVRAKAEAKARSHPFANILLIEDREAPRSLAPEPAPAPVQESLLSVRPNGAPAAPSVQQATIQEVEGQYADRRHWMS
jgi:hypothetical protein